MKVSHAQLELLRANPAAFARQRTTRFGGPSMFRMWQYALKRVHSEGVDAAAEYLRETVLSNFKVNDRNESRLDELVDALYQYATAFASLGEHRCGGAEADES